MSVNIWTRCGGTRNARPLRFDGWRIVEAQHIVSTRKFVDSDVEQHVLEELIDSAKPPVPVHAKSGLHYLLYTPFRYPPLRNGSRFGTRIKPAIFYGALAVPTCLAEVAYYRLLFLEGSSAELDLVETEHTAFRFAVRTSSGIDLTLKPFSKYRELISSPTEHRDSQLLGGQMREAGIEVCLYTSARDPLRGKNLCLFSPAFERHEPYSDLQTWHCSATRNTVELKRRNLLADAPAHVFNREIYLVKGKLPCPAI